MSKVTAKWKWVAKILNKGVSITADGTVRAGTIQTASSVVRRELSEQFKVKEEFVRVHKIYQVGGGA